MVDHWDARTEPIPGYKLLSRLGRGGFGEVWRAEAPGGLLKAIKLVHGDLNDIGSPDEELARQELRSLVRVREIRHPFLISIDRVDIVDGQLVIVMELADGSLWELANDWRATGHPGVPRLELLHYLGEAAEALDTMSLEFDLQHLDIKPQNLLLVGRHVKIADFGLVKDLEGCSAQVTGGTTPVYAAPETFDGWLSRHSDQYSLAIVYQELLTGTRPFPGPTANAYLKQHLYEEPDLSALEGAERPAVLRALSKRPDERFPTCRAFIEALQAAGTVRAPGHGQEVDGRPLRPASLPRRESQLLGDATQLPTEAPVSAPRGEMTSGRRRNTVPPARQEGLVVLLGGLARRLGPLLDAAGDPLRRLELEVIGDEAAADDTPCEAPSALLRCPLQRPGAYLKAWKSATHLHGWLDPNFLLRIGKLSPTNGHAALGRLAFLDNESAIRSRLRRELDSLLPRGARAELRVFVVAGAGGGTGAGMFEAFCDLLHEELSGRVAVTPTIEGVALLGIAPNEAQAGLRAETHRLFLQHLTRSDLHCDRLWLHDLGQAPADQVPASLRPVAELVHSLASGKRGLAPASQRSHTAPAWSTWASFSVQSPVPALLQRTAGRLLDRLFAQWSAPLHADGLAEAEQWLAPRARRLGWDIDFLRERWLVGFDDKLGRPFDLLLDSHLADLEESLAAGGDDEDELDFDPKECLCIVAALERQLDDLVAADDRGAPADWRLGDVVAQRDASPRLGLLEMLESTTNDLCEEITRQALSVTDEAWREPGALLARARAVTDGLQRRLLDIVDQQAEAIRAARRRLRHRVRELTDRLQRLDVASSERILLVDLLRRYASERLELHGREWTSAAILQCRTRLTAHLRKLHGLRPTIEGLRGAATPNDVPVAMADRVIVPPDVTSLETAPREFESRVGDDAVARIHQRLDELVFQPLGGLAPVLENEGETPASFLRLLISHVVPWLRSELRIDDDVAAAWLAYHHGDRHALRQELEALAEWVCPADLHAPPGVAAAPADASPERRRALVRVPVGSAGERIAAEFVNVFGDQGERVDIEEGAGDILLHRIHTWPTGKLLYPAWLCDLTGRGSAETPAVAASPAVHR